MLQRCLIFIVFVVCADLVSAQMRFVTDYFDVMLRTGPSLKNKIVRVLHSGDKLIVLDEDSGNGHSQVKTSQGDIGYVLSRFLTDQPSARQQVVLLERKLKQLRSEPNALRAMLESREDENQQLIAQNIELTEKQAKTQAELDKIKRISSDSVSLSEKNVKLASKVQQLLLQLDDVRIQNETLKDQSDKRWFLLGAAAVVLGVIIGWLLTVSYRQRRQHNFFWSDS